MSLNLTSLTTNTTAQSTKSELPGEQYVIDPKDRELKATDFMQILVAQLVNQNPYQPMDSSQMMEQLGSLSSVRLSESLEGFSRQQNLVLGQGYLGREVVVQPSGEDPVTGVVTAVVGVGKDKCQLVVNNTKYDVSDVVEIRSATSQPAVENSTKV